MSMHDSAGDSVDFLSSKYFQSRDARAEERIATLERQLVSIMEELDRLRWRRSRLPGPSEVKK